MDCVHCICQGVMSECKKEICGVHNTWYALEQQKAIDEMRKAIFETSMFLSAIDFDLRDEEWENLIRKVKDILNKTR